MKTTPLALLSSVMLAIGAGLVAAPSTSHADPGSLPARIASAKQRHQPHHVDLLQSPSGTFALRYPDRGTHTMIYRLGSRLGRPIKVGTFRDPNPGTWPSGAFALDSDHLWVGYGGTYECCQRAHDMRTVDGGESWSEGRYLHTDFHAGSGVSTLFADSDDGWSMVYSAVAQYAGLFRTTDAGATWTKIATNRGHRAQPLSFAPIIRTPDGGLWQSAEWYQHAALDHSANGGVTWHKVRLPRWVPRHHQVLGLAESGGVLLMPISWPVGHNTYRLAALTYRAGTWRRSRSIRIRRRLALDESSVAMASPTRWAVGALDNRRQPLISSRNGGRTWIRHRLPARLVSNPEGNAFALGKGMSMLIGRYRARHLDGPWHRLRLGKDYAPRATTPVVGAREFASAYGEGWGTVRPRNLNIFGDGTLGEFGLRWHAWGKPVAYGEGALDIFRRHGGGHRSVRSEVAASNLGECRGRLTYRTLEFRQFTKSGVPRPWRPYGEHHGDVCTPRKF